jgi:hypothetical protein
MLIVVCIVLNLDNIRGTVRNNLTSEFAQFACFKIETYCTTGALQWLAKIDVLCNQMSTTKETGRYLTKKKRFEHLSPKRVVPLHIVASLSKRPRREMLLQGYLPTYH